MLKQSALFNKIRKNNLSFHEYSLLVSLYTNSNLWSAVRSYSRYYKLEPFITEEKLNEKGIKLIESIDTLFKPIKILKRYAVLGNDADENIEKFMNMFPTHKLPNGKYARGNKKNIEENLIWFFQEYNYNWDIIHQATYKYVVEYHAKNYQYMRTAMYFIKKVIDGTSVSELANYCDIIKSGDDYTEERYIKTKVV